MFISLRTHTRREEVSLHRFVIHDGTAPKHWFPRFETTSKVYQCSLFACYVGKRLCCTTGDTSRKMWCLLGVLPKVLVHAQICNVFVVSAKDLVRPLANLHHDRS